jgi:hypothetical protein
MQIPAFLKCSHRFCRDCLDQQIRKVGENRQCPVCKIQSKSKKEVREDTSISTLISVVFGDVEEIRHEIELI